MDSQLKMFEPTVVTPHPGETIMEYLEFHDWSQRDLARRTGLTPKTISEICNGKASITPPTALALERVLQRPAHFWLNLQRQYEEAQARQRETAKLDQWKEWADKFPVAVMKRYGWLEASGRKHSKVESLLNFFGVSSPDSWNSVWQSCNVAYRQTRKFQKSPEAISAWVRATEVFAAELEFEVKAFDETRIRASFDELRYETTKPAEEFTTEVQRWGAEVGLVVVWVPELPQTGISGCARWLTDKKPLIALTLRYKTDDQLWFTFFHELAHILLHRKRYLFILDNAAEDLRDGVVDPQMQKEEEEANRFASDLLIPPKRLFEFIHHDDFSNEAILSFSEDLGIGPGIVIGRLQREGLLRRFQGNKLKRTFDWVTVDQSQVDE